MKRFIALSLRNPVIAKIIVPLGIFSCMYLAANVAYFSWSSDKKVRTALQETNNVVSETISYHEGQWDVSSYVNSKLSHTGPLYIVTVDGFVIDRKNIINGLLDVSDYRFSSSFQLPQTLTTPAGQRWRLYSKPIFSNNVVVGVITTGYAQPEFSSAEEIDSQLQYAASEILSQINVTPTIIDVSQVKTTSVSNKIAFEVVNKFNQVLESSGGLPSYIDRSYVSKYLKQGFETIEDKETKEKYLVYFSPFYKNSSQPVGFIASGYSLRQVRKDLYTQIAFSLTAGVFITGFMLISITTLLKKDVPAFLEKKQNKQEQKCKGFSFNKKSSIISIGNKQLKVPFASNQFCVCKVLFSNPQKRWEYDEILEKGFGLDSFEEVKSNWRKIYDAVRAVNEKSKEVFGQEVIISEAKTFQVSSDNHVKNIESN